MSTQQAQKTKKNYIHKIHFSRNWKLFPKKIKILYSRREVLTAVTTKTEAVSDVTVCSQVDTDRLSKKRSRKQDSVTFQKTQIFKEIPFQLREM